MNIKESARAVLGVLINPLTLINKKRAGMTVVKKKSILNSQPFLEVKMEGR